MNNIESALLSLGKELSSRVHLILELRHILSSLGWHIEKASTQTGDYTQKSQQLLELGVEEMQSLCAGLESLETQDLLNRVQLVKKLLEKLELSTYGTLIAKEG